MPSRFQRHIRKEVHNSSFLLECHRHGLSTSLNLKLPWLFIVNDLMHVLIILMSVMGRSGCALNYNVLPMQHGTMSSALQSEISPCSLRPLGGGRAHVFYPKSVMPFASLYPESLEEKNQNYTLRFVNHVDSTSQATFPIDRGFVHATCHYLP